MPMVDLFEVIIRQIVDITGETSSEPALIEHDDGCDEA